MDTQIGVRFPTSMVSEIDKLVEKEEYMNRSDAVRDLTRIGLRDRKVKMGCL